MAKDEFGIEIDPEVEAALKDPKSTVLQKVVRYFSQRDAAEKAKALEDEAKNKPVEKPWWNIG